MYADLSRFKVVHRDKVFSALALMGIRYSGDVNLEARDIVVKPVIIDVLVINEDGNIVSICDEAWTFQFLPIVGKEKN